MQIHICDASPLTLEDGTIGTFTDKNGTTVALLMVDGDCWREVSTQPARAGFDWTKEDHTELETQSSMVPAGDPVQRWTIQATKVCRDLSGRIVSCPPR